MISVSILDEDLPARKSLCRLLQGSGRYQCISTYPDPPSAKRGLVMEQPRVVIFDPRFAQGSIMDSIRWLKPRLARTDFLAFSVHCDSQTIMDAIHAGVNGYLCKRLGPDRMIAALDELVAGGSPLSGSVARTMLQTISGAHLQKVAALPATLTRREEEILAEVVKGRMLKEITTALDISQGTVNTHMRNLYRKLEVNSRQEIMIRYFSGGNASHFPTSSPHGAAAAMAGESSTASPAAARTRMAASA